MWASEEGGSSADLEEMSRHTFSPDLRPPQQTLTISTKITEAIFSYRANTPASSLHTRVFLCGSHEDFVALRASFHETFILIILFFLQICCKFLSLFLADLCFLADLWFLCQSIIPI